MTNLFLSQQLNLDNDVIVLVKTSGSGNKAVNIYTLNNFFNCSHSIFPSSGKQITLMNINYQNTKKFFWDLSDEEFEKLILPFKNTNVFKIMANEYHINKFFKENKINKYDLR